MSSQNTALQPHTRLCLLHVIAKHSLATAHAFLSFACHCEPVRTLVWQSASPQECLASWLLFGQIRGAFQICPKYCFSFCAAARSTDCHVAALLAMTCNNLLRVRAARTYYRSNPHPPAHSPSSTPLHPQKCPCLLPIAASLQTQARFCLLHVIANQCKMGTGAHLCGPEKAMQRSD